MGILPLTRPSSKPGSTTCVPSLSEADVSGRQVKSVALGVAAVAHGNARSDRVASEVSVGVSDSLNFHWTGLPGGDEWSQRMLDLGGLPWRLSCHTRWASSAKLPTSKRLFVALSTMTQRREGFFPRDSVPQAVVVMRSSSCRNAGYLSGGHSPSLPVVCQTASASRLQGFVTCAGHRT